MKPFSQACENNKQPILQKLRVAFSDCSRILEIGSGTGQHAVYFAEQLPHLCWLTSDLAENHGGMLRWLADARAENLQAPLALNVSDPGWPGDIDGIFTANTLHIMAWQSVQDFFSGVGRSLPAGGVLCVYGPFNYGGCYTSPSNADFDAWLKARDPRSGIRDFEAVDALARAEGLVLRQDHAMPANNRLLVWRLAAVTISNGKNRFSHGRVSSGPQT